MNRRQFIKGTALVTGALVLGVDWAKAKDVGWTATGIVNDKGKIVWVNKTSNEIIGDVKAGMNTMFGRVKYTSNGVKEFLHLK